MAVPLQVSSFYDFARLPWRQIGVLSPLGEPSTDGAITGYFHNGRRVSCFAYGQSYF